MPFWELRVRSAPDVAEGLANFLWEQGALGVVEEERPGEAPLLRAFFASHVAAPDLDAAVTQYLTALDALGLHPAARRAEIAPLVEEPWATAWQQAFPRREVGRRLLVAPPWDRGAADGRLAIVIEPGRAFGTGQHGSTESCLRLIEDVVEAAPPERVLDVGTGSGILAVAALRLGAARATAIDVDPDAIASARVNAELNGVTAAMELTIASPEEVPAAEWPLVLANLLTAAHLRLGREYRRLVAHEGLLVLGGMLDSEDERVAEHLGLLGFARESRAVVEGWAALLLRRRAT